ncbi:hypothetical protein BH10PLA1_BH10PLA1_17530 [soil metagenome]
MRFKVTGQNKNTGARQTLEFEAESKAAAERKALQSGMTVNNVEDITDGEVAHTGVTRGGSRPSAGGGMFKKLIVLVIILAAAYLLMKSGVVKLPAKKP